MKEGGNKKSKHVGIWVLDAFKKWFEAIGYSLEKSIGDLLEER